MNKASLEVILQKIKSIYQRADQGTRGKLGIIRSAFTRFSQKKASRAAAGMTYYTMFSLFPFLIIMVTVASFFVEGQQASQEVAQLMSNFIPVSQNLVRKNIQRILDLRGSVGLIGLVGFAWSASNAFSMLVDNINQAFPAAEIRTFLKKRLVAFAILGVIIVTLILVMLSSTTLSLLSTFQVPLFGGLDIYNSFLWSLITQISPWVITFILFLNLFRWVPNSQVSWIAAAWSSLVVTLLWQLAALGFNWYLGSGLSNYELVYGSLSTVVILLLWIYLSTLIIFFGAHLCAAVNSYIQSQPK